MAHKQKPQKDTAAYWNRRLARAGLSVNAGLHPRIVYVGGTGDVEYIEGARRTDTGKVVSSEPEE